jgi:hypothetical protein
MIKFIKKGYKIKEKFLNFYNAYPYLDFEQAIEFYAIFGGIEELVELELFDDILGSLGFCYESLHYRLFMIKN